MVGWGGPVALRDLGARDALGEDVPHVEGAGAVARRGRSVPQVRDVDPEPGPGPLADLHAVHVAVLAIGTVRRGVDLLDALEHLQRDGRHDLEVERGRASTAPGPGHPPCAASSRCRGCRPFPAAPDRRRRRRRQPRTPHPGSHSGHRCRGRLPTVHVSSPARALAASNGAGSPFGHEHHRVPGRSSVPTGRKSVTTGSRVYTVGGEVHAQLEADAITLAELVLGVTQPSARRSRSHPCRTPRPQTAADRLVDRDARGGEGDRARVAHRGIAGLTGPVDRSRRGRQGGRVGEGVPGRGAGTQPGPPGVHRAASRRV